MGCRVSALQVFCRCLASAPRLDMVLQLRGAPTVDGESVETVLQRVVFLCHHELLCLGIHGVDGGPWHDPALNECAKRRQRGVELSLMILSSFVWHAVPEINTPNHAVAFLKHVRPWAACGPRWRQSWIWSGAVPHAHRITVGYSVAHQHYAFSWHMPAERIAAM